MVWTTVLDLKPSLFLVSDCCSNYRYDRIVARKHHMHQGVYIRNMAHRDEVLCYFWLHGRQHAWKIDWNNVNMGQLHQRTSFGV
jgi:hypothetical protein